MLQNAPNCTIQKIDDPPPLANPAYAHELLLRNLFENPKAGRQLIVCSTL